MGVAIEGVHVLLQGVQPHQATSTDHQWVWLYAIQG